MLPRLPDNASVVDVQFKRKLDMKNTHKHSYIRASAPLNAVKKLKELGNPFYTDVQTDENYLDKIIETDNPQDEENDDLEEPSDEECHRGGFGINAKTLTDADTCLVPENLESEVVTAGDQPPSSDSIKLAPGKYL